MEEEQQDPRVKPGICGVTTTGALGIEWICVKEPHAKIYTRRSGLRRGAPIFSDNPQGDYHYFVNRWPNRPIKDSLYGDKETEEALGPAAIRGAPG